VAIHPTLNLKFAHPVSSADPFGHLAGEGFNIRGHNQGVCCRRGENVLAGFEQTVIETVSGGVFYF
jgi:hypothetical protein